MKLFLLALVFLLTLWRALPVLAADESDVHLAGRLVTVWDDGHPGKKAALIFSHGFHGCSTQSRRLMNAFADQGYLVFAPNHKDAVCHQGEASFFSWPQMAFRQASSWNDRTYADRGDDIRAVVSALKTDAAYRDRIDWNALALVGHSLGGYTVLALAGAWPGWILPGVRAVLAFSPFCLPFSLQGTLKELKAPVMFQGGTRDQFITPFIAGANGCYSQSAAPKYFVTFSCDNHFSWSDRENPEGQTSILAYSLAFLDRYVRGRAPSIILSHPAGTAQHLEEQVLP